MQPAIGITVHYQEPDEQGGFVTRAAMISEILPDDVLTLFIFGGKSIYLVNAPKADVPTLEHWNWP